MEMPKLNRPIRNLIGQKFNRLLVKEYAGSRLGNAFWLCICDCGKRTTVMGGKLRTGKTKSCGCLNSETTAKRNYKHGKSKTREYHVWWSMQQRCYNPNNKQYKYWGGRGITVCDRWRESFSNFYQDIGDIPLGMSIDRINNDGNYEPTNCRIATAEMQARNKRKTH